LVVGLTGGIATGKTTVAGILKELGAAIINADEIAREVVQPGSPVLEEVVRAFGPGYLDREGSLDRRKLGQRVFGDPEALEKLNSIVHPYLRMEICRRIEQIGGESPLQPIVLEAAVLFEMGADSLVDLVLVTHCSREVQLARLLEGGRMTQAEAEQRINSQMAGEEFVRRADALVDTGGSPAETTRQVEALWRQCIGERQEEGAEP